jgi:hypothetical protein
MNRLNVVCTIFQAVNIDTFIGHVHTGLIYNNFRHFRGCEIVRLFSIFTCVHHASMTRCRNAAAHLPPSNLYMAM